MQEFKKGQRVKVEFSPIEGEILSAGVMTLQLAVPGSSYQRLIELSQVKVTLLDPSGWPPQVGDIWEANGKEYFIRVHCAAQAGLTAAQPADGLGALEESRLKALNPVLVRRRGQ